MYSFHNTVVHFYPAFLLYHQGREAIEAESVEERSEDIIKAQRQTAL